MPTFRLPAAKEVSDLALLAMNEAVAFFVDQARAVRPDFLLSVENAPAVAEICHRLDGLPLALELAAARIKLLPPATLLTRLDARLPLLTRGTRDAPQRQRSLRDVIAWSHDLLNAEERALFRRLAVFARGCTIDAAEVVVDPDGTLDVFGGIASLVDKSLLRQEIRSEQEPRFGLLETIREYGLDQLAVSGEEPVTRDRHAAWVLALVERAEPELFGSAQQTWSERLDAERPNIGAALAWFEQSGDAERAQRLAGSATMFCLLRGYLREGQDWLRRALAIPGETSPRPARVRSSELGR